MKKLLCITFCLAAFACAGPLKVATYPLMHPKKDAHAIKVFVKSLLKGGKALW